MPRPPITLAAATTSRPEETSMRVQRECVVSRGRPRRAGRTLLRTMLAGVVAAALAPLPAAAQNLLELYDLAHGYDATYLAARAQAESAPYRVEQARALMRPSATLSSSA
jgi:hypothetical protein